jgi:hypothetical protein
VAQPRRHRRRLVDLVEPGGVEVGDRGGDLGVEARAQLQHLAQLTGDREDLDLVDRFPQPREHG